MAISSFWDLRIPAPAQTVRSLHCQQQQRNQDPQAGPDPTPPPQPTFLIKRPCSHSPRWPQGPHLLLFTPTPWWSPLFVPGLVCVTEGGGPSLPRFGESRLQLLSWTFSPCLALGEASCPVVSSPMERSQGLWPKAGEEQRQPHKGVWKLILQRWQP